MEESSFKLYERLLRLGSDWHEHQTHIKFKQRCN